MLGTAKSYTAIFSLFWTANHFPKSKTLSASAVSSNITHFLVCLPPLNNFYCIFYYLTSEHFAPSDGLKVNWFLLFYYTKGWVCICKFIKNLRNKLSILGMYKSLQYCCAKITILRCINLLPTPTVECSKKHFSLLIIEKIICRLIFIN